MVVIIMPGVVIFFTLLMVVLLFMRMPPRESPRSAAVWGLALLLSPLPIPLGTEPLGEIPEGSKAG